MAQGKLKMKSKSSAVKNTAQAKNKKKGPQIQRRGNAPIKPKKVKAIESKKLKQMVSKSLNHAMESELREKALGGKTSLTKKQVTPAPKNHKKI